MYILVETSQQSTEVFQYFSLLYCSVLVLYISDVWGCYVVNGRELIVRHSVPRGERGHSTRLHQLKSVGHPLPFVAKETNNCNFAPSVVDQLCVHSQGFVFTFKALCAKCCWSTMCSHSRLCVHIQGFVFIFKALFGNNLMLRLQDNQTSWRHKERHPDSKTDSHKEVVWQRNMTVERKQWQMETAVVNVYAVWTKMM